MHKSEHVPVSKGYFHIDLFSLIIWKILSLQCSLAPLPNKCPVRDSCPIFLLRFCMCSHSSHPSVVGSICTKQMLGHYKYPVPAQTPLLERSFLFGLYIITSFSQFIAFFMTFNFIKRSLCSF